MLRATAIARRIVGPRNKMEKWGKRQSSCKANVRLVMGGSSEEEIRERKGRKEGEGEIILYTDRSKMGDRIGAGVWWMRGEEEWSEVAHLGKRMEVFDAEMFALWLAIKTGREEARKRNLHKITIRADNQAAL